MVKNVCVTCFKEFANKSNLNRHTETFHSSHVQPPVDDFDDPTQSGELYSDDAVQSTSQTKFENADNKVDDASQDDDWSRTDSESSTSDGYYGNEFYSRNTMVKYVCVPCFKVFANKVF